MRVHIYIIYVYKKNSRDLKEKGNGNGGEGGMRLYVVRPTSCIEHVSKYVGRRRQGATTRNLRKNQMHETIVQNTWRESAARERTK